MGSPRIHEELLRLFSLYEHTKKSFIYLGGALSLSEWVFLNMWSLTMKILFTHPVTDLTYFTMGKLKIFDDFICHQLDFVEKQLKDIDTGIIYRPGGIIDRIIMVARLLFRVTFVFPRLTWKIFTACMTMVKQEITENIDLAVTIIVPELPRRSKRNQSNLSPSKKRKHEGINTDGYPDYLVCVNYCEQEDPDYEPELDDTELTSASENSQSESEHDEEEESPQKNASSPLKNVAVEEINQNIDVPSIPAGNVIVS